MAFLDSSKLKRHWLTHPGVGHLRHMCPYQKCGQAFETAAERASQLQSLSRMMSMARQPFFLELMEAMLLPLQRSVLCNACLPAHNAGG